MYTIARLALAFLLLPTISFADVLIYRGTYKAYPPSLGATEAPVQKCYVVLGDGADGGTYDVVILHYGKRAGVKKVEQEQKRTAILKTITAQNGANYATLAFAEFVTGGGFALRSSAIFLRGKNQTLTLSNAPVVTRTFPRTLGGIFRESITAIVKGNDYSDANFNVVLDGPRTLAANNANKEIDATVADLMGELNAAGFVSE
jgi:hypothetical protein